jgi:hypothetical protein
MDARSIPPIVVPGEFTRDPSVMTLKLADVLSNTYGGQKVAMLFMDSAGIAGPVDNRLRQLGHTNLMVVNFGADSPDIKYANMRAYMWGQMKEWLLRGAIDKSAALESDLTGPGYTLDKKQRVLLEPKDKMKKRGLASPDHGDSLALTFAAPVMPPAIKRPSSIPVRRSGWS